MALCRYFKVLACVRGGSRADAPVMWWRGEQGRPGRGRQRAGGNQWWRRRERDCAGAGVGAACQERQAAAAACCSCMGLWVEEG